MNNKSNGKPDSEDIFLSSVLKQYTFWKKKVAEIEKNRGDSGKEKDYAEAYRLLLNQFSHIEEKESK